MYKRARVTTELGGKLAVFKVVDGKPVIEAVLVLEEFSVLNGSIRWMFKTNKGELIVGGVKDRARLPTYEDSWVTLMIPATLHFFKTISIDFMFCLPNSRRIISQFQFEREFPNVAL